MKKSLLASTTTQNVAAAGTMTGAALSLGEVLQQAFPESSILANPAVTVFGTFILNTVVLPWLSRMIAKLRGK